MQLKDIREYPRHDLNHRKDRIARTAMARNAPLALTLALAVGAACAQAPAPAPERAAQLGWASQLRGLAVAAGLVLGALVFLATAKGRGVRDFLGESRFELRKVVWPTRQETTRMTWVVIAVVVILSLILAGFDFFIKWAIELFLNFGR